LRKNILIFINKYLKMYFILIIKLFHFNCSAKEFQNPILGEFKIRKTFGTGTNQVQFYYFPRKN